MNETISVISFTNSGKILMYVIIKNNSGKEIILSSKSCELIDLLVSDVIEYVNEEIYNKTQEHIKEVILVLPHSLMKISQNRGYVVRASELDEINTSDMTELLNDMYKIHPFEVTKVVNIASIYYSVDDTSNIKDPRGMHGKRLEGKFHTLHVNKEFVDKISYLLSSQGITIKKFIPANMRTANSFLTIEEREALSIIDLNK
jgi:cell division protein FtsA